MAFHQIHDALDGSRPDPTSRHRGLPLAGLFLCALFLGPTLAVTGCSQPETREARPGAEAARSAGEATRNEPSPVQYRTNTSDAGTEDARKQDRAEDDVEDRADAQEDAEQSTPDAE